MKYLTTTKEERCILIGKYPTLYKEVELIIEEVDPVGLAFLDNEYDLEILDIMGNLSNCETVLDVREMVYEVFTFWFSVDRLDVLRENKSFDTRIFNLKAML
jgi:hypothetical protein